MTALLLKPFGILIYAGFGGLYLSAASVREKFVTTMTSRAGLILAAALVGGAISLLMLFAIAGSYRLVSAVAIGTAGFAVIHFNSRSFLALFSAFAAVTLVMSLAWWRIEPSPASALPLAAFAAILGGMTLAFSGAGRSRSSAIPLAVFLLAGFLLQIDLGGYRPGQPITFYLAHHWGAYIGPALHLRSGLIPFYDMPLQYGLGPTLTIAASCHGTDCWTGMECFGIAFDLACGALILRMVLATSVPRGSMWQSAATVVVFAAVFLWPGAAAEGSGLLAQPNVGGIRFLPVTLVAFLLFFGRPTSAAAAMIPALLWSPEFAAMSVVVFGLCEAPRIGFIAALLRGCGLVAVAAIGLILSHRAIFGVWMDPLAFVEYILHVPGAMPINPISDALLLVAVLGLGGWMIIRRSPDPVAARRDNAATFLLFAAASYWLGRSHPNNICNLMPFMVLVSFRVLDRQSGDRSVLADVTRFGLATSVAALAMSFWHSPPYELPAIVDVHALVADFPLLEPDIEQIRARIANSDGLGIADLGPSYTRDPAEKIVWTPMDPSSLWSFVPDDRRRLYIQRSAARLRRAGWAIVDDEQRFLYDGFDAGYIVAEQREFLGAPSPLDGSRRHYLAACLNPRPDVAPSVVGPSCPPMPGFTP